MLTREEWLARRLLRREKQRPDNVVRAAIMHAARLQAAPNVPERQHHGAHLKSAVYVVVPVGFPDRCRKSRSSADLFKDRHDIGAPEGEARL